MTKKNEQASKASENGSDMAGHGKQGKENQAPKSQIALLEESVLEFWQKNKIFEQSVEKEAPLGDSVFYDGPPFATGLPHYGHLLAGFIKDTLPRYQTMKGYRIKRRWGWDCHGLPIESLIQKENDLKTKKDIEDFGIKKFNEAARASVFRYDADWRKVVPRSGRWVDMDDQYTTMDSTFTESCFWAFKTLHEKNLVYKDFKSMHISPLLETPLSNFEVNQAYKDITDISVYAKFPIKGEEKTFAIAWTTTPWTLPANAALAVGAEIDYVKVEHDFTVGKDETGNPKTEKQFFILAKGLLEKVFKDRKYKIVEEMKGADLIGKSYESIFDYYSSQKDLENSENGWKIYGADFVTTEDGTGIVHIAPAFGEDDLVLGRENNLPFLQHVNIDGTIREEVKDFAGRQAKPKATAEEPTKYQETDIEIIKYLAHNGRLFEKEKFTHSYPHCERTDAPLLNYAMSAWFVRVTDYRDKMIRLNKKVNWIPSAVGEKRFGNWLENIKDWNVSRSRFWGTPMPIWQSEDESETEVLGSLEEIRERTAGTNKYFVMRHGEGDHNVGAFLSSDDTVPSHMTEKGKNDVQKVAAEMKDKEIDLIFCSPLMRTKETAEILKNKLGLKDEQVIFDDRIREIHGGNYNGKTEEEYFTLFKNELDKFTIAPEGGETLTDVRRRVGDFIYDINEKYSGKNILIITHDSPAWMLEAVRMGLENKKAATLRKSGDYITPGEFTEYDFAPIPHNDDYILDFHRPYIDDIVYKKDGKEMRRIPEVFDTWFDSGSMPFAINHYPFSKETFDVGNIFNHGKGFPAEFIAEGLDQTRGWFYTLLAMNTGLFGKAPYKNVVVNGLVLAEDGRKMSKKLKNYPDTSEVFDKYGADATRYYMLNSPIVRSEPLSFSEKGVDEIVKKITNRLLNVVSFYKLYAVEDFADSEVRPTSDNPLDQWILARLSETAEQVTDSLEKYELDRAARPFLDFVDDLSTWYLRRSRDRFKSGTEVDKNLATKTIAYVLYNTSKIIAPFMPFLAEEIYQRITGFEKEHAQKSVHLLSWPKLGKADKEVLDNMKSVREIVALALEARDKEGIKVRQPLSTLSLSETHSKLSLDLLEIIKDEVNIKEITFENNLEAKKVQLNTEITKELAEEGLSRDLIRHVQSMRKNAKLEPSDVIVLEIVTNEAGQSIIKKFDKEIRETVNAKEVKFAEEESADHEILEVGEQKFAVKI